MQKLRRRTIPHSNVSFLLGLDTYDEWITERDVGDPGGGNEINRLEIDKNECNGTTDGELN